MAQPKYPIQFVVKLENMRINFRAGALFDLNGCINDYVRFSQDWYIYFFK